MTVKATNNAAHRRRQVLARKVPERDQRFLALLDAGLSVSAACAASGYSRASAYHRRANDANFAKAWADAYEGGTDRLEDEALRRGKDGVEKAIFYMGKKVGSERRYSDALLATILKGRRPEKWRERYIAKVLDDLADLTDEQLQARFIAVLDREPRVIEAMIAALQSDTNHGGDAPPATHRRQEM